MPRVAENLPTALRSILENENFIQMENQAIRAIMDEPLNADRRYDAGIMYQNFGLLCPAMQSFEQTVVLNPDHKHAQKQLADLLDQGVSSEDDEGIYQLPPLKNNQEVKPFQMSKTVTQQPLSINRWGTIESVALSQLRQGDSDLRLKVTELSANHLVLRSRSGLIFVAGLLGLVGLILVASMLIAIFMFEMKAGRIGPVLIGITIVSASALASFAYLGVSFTIHGNGTIIKESFFGEDEKWELAPGSYVLFAMNDQVILSTKHCTVAIVDANDVAIMELGTISLASQHSSLYVRIAAAVAAVLGVPLKIEGSMRHDNPRLKAAVMQISSQMQPLISGATL
jgi:hypothetical protein